MEAKRRSLPEGKLPYSDFLRKVRVKPDCKTLACFLETFEFFYGIAQSPSFIERAAHEVVLDWVSDGVIYGETRFAPHLLSKPDDKIDQIIEAALRGLKKGEGETGVKTGLILTMMRQRPVKELEELLSAYHRYSSEGVVGIDLAGDEHSDAGNEYIPLFKKASEEGVPVTIHAGEGTSYKNVLLAVNEMGARRIGHGISAAENSECMNLLHDRKIPLELCLTSNLQTGSVYSYLEHPVGDFLNNDIPVTLNTDDPQVSGITLSYEWEVFIANFFPTRESIQKILLNSVSAAFTDTETKNMLQEKIVNFFTETLSG